MHERNASGFAFYTGEVPTLPCPSCGSDAPSGARFCPSCGHLLVETEERRIVTVLFADLVGFTALSEDADPEDIKHLIDTCFQRLVADVGAFGGTVDKIIGDAILALFGAPIAHEDDPERALRTAFRMRKSLADFSAERGIELQLRSGINTGEALVGALHAGGDYTVMGDTVNIASRLQGMAEPGEVLVGATTAEATTTVVQYEGRGELELRGRSEPVGVFVAAGELAPPGRRRASKRAPLVGRNLELQQLTSAINTAIARRRAQLVQIVGEAGVGKSRLAEEVTAEIAAEHGALVLSSMVLPYDEANPLRALGDAISNAAGVSHNDSNTHAEQKIEALVADALDGSTALTHPAQRSAGQKDTTKKSQTITQMVMAMLGRTAGLVAGASSASANPSVANSSTGSTSSASTSSTAFPEVSEPNEHGGASHGGAVHGGAAHGSAVHGSAGHGSGTVAAMAELFAALMRSRPVVLLVGDIHWADERLLRLLEKLLEDLASQNFVVLTTARWTVDDKRWTAPPGRHNIVVLNLDPLNVSATAELVNALLGFETSAELISQLHARSGGNPFYLEEISTLLRDAGASGANSSPNQADRPLTALPSTLRGLVAARLDSLSEEERKLVDDAAVLGSSGNIRDLLTSSGLTAAEDQIQPGVSGVERVEEVFYHLIDKDIFDIEDRTWRFRSDLVREVSYARLTKADRAQRHIRVAEWLAEDIAEKSAEYVLMVANHLATAIELGAATNDLSAPGLNGSGLTTTLGPSITDAAIEWLERAGQSATARESHFVADQLYRRAIDLLSSDDERLVQMSLGRSKARLGLGELSGAKADAESARSLAARQGNRSATAKGLLLLGRIALTSDEHAQAEALLADASGQFQALGEVREAAEALRLRGFALLRAGDHSRADRYINEAHATFVHLKDKSGIAWCLQSLAWLSFEQGLIEQADERLYLAIETFTEEGNTVGLAIARGLQAFLLFHSGKRREAEEMANDVRSIVHQRGERFTEAMMDLLLGSISLWSGQATIALARANAAEQVFTRIGSAFGVVQALGLQGRAYAALGELQRSRTLLVECLRRAEGMPGQPLKRFAQAVRAGGSVQIGDPRSALEDVRYAADATYSHGPLVIGTLELGVSEGLALLQLGKVAEAVQALEAVAEMRSDKAPSMYLDSSLALAYCAAGRTEEAHERAKVALDSGTGTYLDVRTALLAQALAYARAGADRAGRASNDRAGTDRADRAGTDRAGTDRAGSDRANMVRVLNQALAAIDETDSRTSQAIVRLARALSHKAIESLQAEEMAAEAEVALAKLDTRPFGWETAFCLAAGLEPPAAPTDYLPEAVPYVG